MRDISELIRSSIVDLYDEKVEVELTRPEPQFGDYSSSVALKLAKQVGKSPKEIAQSIAEKVSESEMVANVQVAGPGFINIKLTDKALVRLIKNGPTKSFEGMVVLVEFSDPNPFKILHAGHVYTTVVGDAISNLFEAAGATVHRVNFGGDVGLHVARTTWSILKQLGGENPGELEKVTKDKRAEWLAAAYVEGTAVYEDGDEATKQEIVSINKRIYELHKDDDHESDFAKIYWTTREWSYQHFDEFYARLGTKFDKVYPESEVAELGLKTVKEHIGKVYEESDGAIIFKGEEHGLHTRVFINKEGLPTYEAKDVGLVFQKDKDYSPDLSIILTGNEQEQYLNVVYKSIEQFDPQLAGKTKRIHNGLLKMSGGEKMSSRKGNILKAVDILDAVQELVAKEHEGSTEAISLGAIRYAMLKSRIGGDIHFDINESVSIQGNSGPYLQYAHARARSILSKAKLDPATIDELTDEERALIRKISELSMVFEEAVAELAPHKISTFLFETAQEFNRFYESNRIIGDAREAQRLTIVELYANVLQQGLELLGIEALETM